MIIPLCSSHQSIPGYLEHYGTRIVDSHPKSTQVSAATSLKLHQPLKAFPRIHVVNPLRADWSQTSSTIPHLIIKQSEPHHALPKRVDHPSTQEHGGRPREILPRVRPPAMPTQACPIPKRASAVRPERLLPLRKGSQEVIQLGVTDLCSRDHGAARCGFIR